MLPKKLPTMREMRGADLIHYPEHERRIVYIEYNGMDGSCYEVEMPLQQAMYLLTHLKRIQEDTSYEMPEE
jgi:hypothetical protein